MESNKENSKKTIYEYDVRIPKETPKPYSSKLLISPLFCAIVVNLTILMTAVTIGFYFGILGSLNSKRFYGDQCKFDTDCETGLLLRCQNGYCNCTSLTRFNLTLLKCVSKQLNGISCSNENDCCCDQKCVYDLNKLSNVCSCTTDRWWDNTNSYCQKKSYYDEACSSNDQCQLNTNLICLSNKCSCSDPNLNFWNGTYCDDVQSYLGICRITPGCNPSQGLICNITEQYPYKCTCPPFNYWDSAASLCKAQKTVSVACTSTEECTSDTGLYCDTNCKCLDNYFWSTNKCIKRMTFGEYCSITLLCDTTTGLSCINSYCACTGSRFWNSSFCVSPISSGLNCDNSYSCNSALGLSCDRTTNQCVCASTHYWSLQGSCRLKEINGTWCTHSLQCQTQNGLSCVTNRCFCAEYHYWSGTKCLLKQTVNTWCTQTYQCQDYNGLVCLNTGGKQACECQYPRYWNGNQCVDKLSHGLSCSLDSECNQNLGLACYGQCRCDASRYWTGTICSTKKNFGSGCSQNYACKDNLALLCLSGVCSCMPLMYWSNSKCEFKRSESDSCNGSNPACQNYAGLSCTTGSCRCSSTQYWVANKCQNFVGINQICDGTTYRCKTGLICQGSAAGNNICQCGAGTYWTGTSCASVRTHGQTCDGWRVPCDHSKKLKCLSSGEGSSCYSGYSGTRCNCIDTDYWSGSTCVPKLLDHVITNVSCQCRQDLGLSSLSYENTYTCYNNYFPDKTCACQNTQYWGGEKCVNKKTQNVYCTTNCQCKENLGLKCWAYTDGYSCYADFGDGKRCLCETVTQWWTGTTCVNKYWNANNCGSTCQCREDKGLGCQSFGDYNRYSCTNSYTGTKCYCKLSTNFWSGTTNGCISKYSHFVSCSTNCQCREDLGLACRAYAGFYSCNTYFSDNRCTCANLAFWDGSMCVARYGHYVTCASNCQCRMDLGLRCETQNNNCYSYTGSRCVCIWYQYWNGGSCINKGTWASLCSSNCQCRTDLGFICHTWNATPRCYT